MSMSSTSSTSGSTPSAVPDVVVAPCTPEHRSEQVRLFNAVFKKKLDTQRLSWRYDENPHGMSVSFLSRIPSGEAVCGREGRVRGWLTPLGSRRAERGLRALESAGSGASAMPDALRPGWTVRDLTRFPVEVDAIARDVAQGFALMVRRDAAYLNWRFADAPSRLFTILGVFDAREQLHGYCVVQRPRPGEPTGWLVDVLGRDDRAVATALHAGIR